jgi:arginine decarboxylase
MVLEPTDRWSAQDSRELFDVASWGKGYFSIGDEGHIRAPSI